MKLTHPCKDTCSGYSQDCAEQIEQLQARVKELEAENSQLKINYDVLAISEDELGKHRLEKMYQAQRENARLRKVVDAARKYKDAPFGNVEAGKAYEAMSAALRELDGEKICSCGHDKSAHIYEEGACRPGFECEQRCEQFRQTR